MKNPLVNLLWVAIALSGAWAYATLALHRGEPLNSAFVLIAAICSYAIGYRFYSKWIAAHVLTLNDRRATPCEVHDDGKDFCKTNKWIVFGHHFAAISGPGPLVGPVLAAQFGYLPGTLWILIGVVLGGAVQDFVILFASMRRNGKSLGQMVKEELNTTAGFIALLAILAIVIILLAVLALVVVNALAESPWGIFTVGATVPIALFMGGYLRFWRVGKVLEATAIGVALLFLAVWGGKVINDNFALPQFVVKTSAAVNSLFLSGDAAAPSTHCADLFRLRALPIAWIIVLYGLAASVLPVWLLLAPRDYLSTFMKLGTILLLAMGIFAVLPKLHMPAVTVFGALGNGPVFAGKLFPFCFITIACGAISGFHTLIASGTTPKIISRESHARPIGYGAMCLESLVAIMAVIAACTLEPGVYLSMNVKGEAAVTAANITALGYPVTVGHMDDLAGRIGEKTLFGRVGGAPTLAVGMATIFSKAVGGRWLDLWYHFAIMFEALFILTTIDAGTRVARYILQDFLGHLWKPLGDTRSFGANIFTSGLMVAAWGYFLIQGVRDPLGGINSLWPLFGIANQMLAAIALCLATTIILKMAMGAPNSDSAQVHQRADSEIGAPQRWPAFALITLVPLVWLLSVTFTAGSQKIGHPSPSIGFLARAKQIKEELLPPSEKQLERAYAAATEIFPSPEKKASLDKALAATSGLRTQLFNNRLDAVVAGVFLTLVSIIVLSSLREWFLLLARRKPALLRETEPVWLPDYAVAERGRNLGGVAGTAALTLALAKELSGEAQLERAQQQAQVCQCGPADTNDKATQEIYVEITEQRFNGVRRCC